MVQAGAAGPALSPIALVPGAKQADWQEPCVRESWVRTLWSRAHLATEGLVEWCGRVSAGGPSSTPRETTIPRRCSSGNPSARRAGTGFSRRRSGNMVRETLFSREACGKLENLICLIHHLTSLGMVLLSSTLWVLANRLEHPKTLDGFDSSRQLMQFPRINYIVTETTLHDWLQSTFAGRYFLVAARQMNNLWPPGKPV